MATPPDLRPQLAAAFDQAIATVSAVRPDQLGDPTPCPKMDVSGLIDHIVLGARRAAGLSHGRAPEAEGPAPHVDIAEAAPALAAASSEAKEGWSDDDSLRREITMPWGETYPGAALVGIYLIELTTHSWDLAVATGSADQLDEELGATALGCARASIKPEYRTAEGEPFGPEVTPPDDAGVWERLATFMGRSPQ